MADTVVPTIMEIAEGAGYSGDASPDTVIEALEVLGYVLGKIKEEVEALDGAYTFRGTVATASDLPTSGMLEGDVWCIIASSTYGGEYTNVAWNGTAWKSLGNAFQLADGIVTTSKISDGAVTFAKLDPEMMVILSDAEVDAMFEESDEG